MLIYERKSKKNIIELKTDENGNVSEEPEEVEVDFRAVKKFIPEWINDIVDRDNKTFLVDSQLFNQDFFSMCRRILKLTGNDLVLTTHKYPYEYQPNFYKLKKQSLTIAGKIIFDMLVYYEMNFSLSEVVSSFESILTFCDSPYFIKKGDDCLTADFLNTHFLDNGVQ